jgi:CRISPR-associated endonuclease/helicase Cas3
MDFEHDFQVVTGNPPFPWQRALYERFIAEDFPHTCDLPTGLGKTSVLAIWLLALANNARLPRRLVFVVNRRTVVDQATTDAERLRVQLRSPEAQHIRAALGALCAVSSPDPLTISTLRGEFADKGEWRRDPARPAIIVGTVDMIGSRLLFSGYGCGFRSKPLHAGFLGQDALLVHDEAHLEPAFQCLLETLSKEQLRCREPRPLKVLALSATARSQADFVLTPEDLSHPIVKKRLHAAKSLHLHHIGDRRDLPSAMAEAAAKLDGKVMVFLSSVDHAEKCATILRKARKEVVVLTGTMRGAERDSLVTTPIFAAFLPEPPENVVPQSGTAFLVATSAGEVGVNLSADNLVTDLPPFDSLAQRLGRVNRFGEGNAKVHVFAEKLQKASDNQEDSEADDSASSGKPRELYDNARIQTEHLIRALPPLSNGGRSASPAALRDLPYAERSGASTPLPVILHCDALIFDRWSYTTIIGPLPGRRPVAEWLHGKAEWEPPRTTVAWRNEVTWLREEDLGRENLDDFLADYPLRSRETLSDVTSRVHKHLQTIVAQSGPQLAWLVREGLPAQIVKLDDLVGQYDSKKNPILDNATVILAPSAGGLNNGLLDGAAEFDAETLYDRGPDDDRRVVNEAEDGPTTSRGWRLVRAVPFERSDEDVVKWWLLQARSKRADDEGSSTSSVELLLDTHLQRSEAWAVRLAERLDLPALERQALTLAARAHDLGKRRSVWQRSIRRHAEPYLAKGNVIPSLLNHYRHELGSLGECDFGELSEEGSDIALHVIAAHHGRARPHFPIKESYDPELPNELVASLVEEVPLRFDRLQRRYGRWGLAWIESILRAADALGSDEDGPEQ